MQGKRKNNKINNKEEIRVEENINKAIEKDGQIVAKEISSPSLKVRNTKRDNFKNYVKYGFKNEV